MEVEPCDRPLAELFAQIAQSNQRWLEEWVAQCPTELLSVTLTTGASVAQWMASAWEHASISSGGISSTAVDMRFSAPVWRDLPFFDHIRQSYLGLSQYLIDMVARMPVAAAQKAQLQFITQQFIDACAPSNFLMTNPEALMLALASNGQSLQAGMAQWVADMQKGAITMSDERAFEVGVNLAITPGAVVYENALFQLLQYTATTKKTHARPLLIVPPCVNKYYLLDLQPHNSLVRHLVDSGMTTFLISWKSATVEIQHFNWEDYLSQGLFPAMEAVQSITQQKQINALGFCIGGVLLSTALAVLKARGNSIVASATLLTTLIDYQEPGQIKLCIDEVQLRAREAQAEAGGIVSGRELAQGFASLRANALIWRYVVDNYLKGLSPPPFDLLFWNADAVDLPLPMYIYFLRQFYLENRLIEPNALRLCGVPIDIQQLDLPVYVFAAREDHIVPWRSAFASMAYFQGPRRFVLGASGHIAGTINPAREGKRQYWVGQGEGGTSAQWLASAVVHAGSWWTDYTQWLIPHAGKKQTAPARLGSDDFLPIEPAPGRYVKQRAAPPSAGFF